MKVSIYKTKSNRILEFLVLYILIPVSFVVSYPILLKGILAGAGFVYILYHLRMSGLLKPIRPTRSQWLLFLKSMAFRFLFIIIITSIFVFYTSKDQLFIVLLQKPLLWIGILCIYTVFSAWPQEIIYRTFFYSRYHMLFPNRWILMMSNAILFSLAHIFFQNVLVHLLTFIGGFLFFHTYLKTKSTLLVTVEHAVYGSWLFTVGMGEMLAFPGVN